jgi:hypothetical protein
VENEERLSVLNRHQSLAAGAHPDQVKVGLVNSIRFTYIKLAEDGLGAKATLLLDDLEIRNVSVSRDEAGSSKFSLPGMSFRVMTYPVWILPGNVETAIRQLADQILPPAKPLGRDPETGEIITVQNPASDRVHSEHLARAKERISGGVNGMGMTL